MYLPSNIDICLALELRYFFPATEIDCDLSAPAQHMRKQCGINNNCVQASIVVLSIDILPFNLFYEIAIFFPNCGKEIAISTLVEGRFRTWLMIVVSLVIVVLSAAIQIFASQCIRWAGVPSSRLTSEAVTAAGIPLLVRCSINSIFYSCLLSS